MCVCVCRQSIADVLTSHDLNVDNVQVLLQSSNTPLPLEADCYLLGGKTLFVRGEYIMDTHTYTTPLQH